MDDQKFESASLDVKKKKRSPKSRHINVMRRRINKWINSPNRGNICIETLTHPLREGKALISLRQVHKGEKRFGDVIMIHSCLLYTSPSPRDGLLSRMPSSA